MLRACVVRTTLIAPEEAMYGKGPTRSWLEPQSIPEAGQSFTFHGFRFRVLRRSRNRITALRITPLTPRKPVAARAG